MKLALAAALFLAVPTVTISTASACAMRKRPRPMAKLVARNDLPKAIKAEKRGELRTAIRLYERVMNGAASKADRVKAALAASRLHLKSGKTLKAVARARKAVSMDGRNADARLALGQLLIEAEPAVARLHLDRAEILNVADKGALHLAKAQLHLKVGETAAAKVALEKAAANNADAAQVKALQDALAADNEKGNGATPVQIATGA